MRWWEVWTFVATVLAAIFAALAFWVAARREMILTRSHPWAIPVPDKLRELTADGDIRPPAEGPDAEFSYLVGEIVNAGTGPIRHLEAIRRGCEVFSAEGHELTPEFDASWLVPGEGRPFAARYPPGDRDCAWIVTSWSRADHFGGVYLAWFPLLGPSPIADEWKKSLTQKLSRWRRLYFRVSGKSRMKRRVGPGKEPYLFVKAKDLRKLPKDMSPEEYFAPLSPR